MGEGEDFFPLSGGKREKIKVPSPFGRGERHYFCCDTHTSIFRLAE